MTNKVEIENSVGTYILLSDMKAGQYAQVRDTGEIMYRPCNSDDYVVSLCRDAWTKLARNTMDVRILKPGTVIKITVGETYEG